VVKNAERRSTSIDRVLGASVELLAEKGYSGFRSADVAELSGLSQGTVFRYFPTKLELVSASLERSLADHLTRIADSIAAIAPAERNRKTMMATLWEVLASPDFAWTYELYAAAALDPELNGALTSVLKKHRENVDSVVSFIAADMAVGDDASLHKAVNLVLWSMQGLVLNDLAIGPSGRHEELIEYLSWLADVAYGKAPQDS
jgi:AcrR family transcriptional regulator